MADERADAVGASPSHGLTALTGGLAPGVWGVGLELLKDFAAIPWATVLCFALTISSISLWRLSQKSMSKRRAARFCGALVAVGGLLTLSQYLGAWDIPINLWPFSGATAS